MGEKSFKELLKELEEKKNSTNEAILTAKELVTQAMQGTVEGHKLTREGLDKINEAINDTYRCYLSGQAVISDLQDAIALVKRNEKFMKENGDKIEAIDALDDKWVEIFGAFDNIILQLKQNVLKMKVEAGLDDEEDVKSCPDEDEDADKARRKQKKCAPGCVIL